MATTQLKRPSDFDIIETARLYSLNPHLMKARTFAYFQAGFSAGETCLILKTQIKGRSIQTYYSAWKEMSQIYDTISSVEHAPVEGDGLLSASTPSSTYQEEPATIAEQLEAMAESSRRQGEPAHIASWLDAIAQWSRSGFSSGTRPMNRDDVKEYEQLNDLKRENAALKTQVEEARTSHQSIKANLAHVSSCPSCRPELEEYNSKMIIRAIENLSVDAVRELGFEKGAFPRKFTIPGT